MSRWTCRFWPEPLEVDGADEGGGGVLGLSRGQFWTVLNLIRVLHPCGNGIGSWVLGPGVQGGVWTET